MPVPVQITWTTGQVVTAAQMNSNIRDSVNFLLGTPRCVMTRVNATGWASTSTPQLFTFDSVIIDSDSMTTTAGQFTANTAGRYEFELYLHWVYVSPIPTLHCGINLNGAGTWGAGGGKLCEDTRTGSNNAWFNTATSVRTQQYMNVGDYVQFFALITTSGGQILGGQFDSQASGRWVASS